MPPDFHEFHRSLARELEATKDRVRHLVAHWPADGEHKEAVLRSVLRRHVGESVLVGRGFIVAPDTEARQIDVLLVDRDAPTLFRDGDLFIVTPDAVRAVLEVKTCCDGANRIREAIIQLRERVAPWAGQPRRRIWSGLFVYEGGDCPNARVDVMRALATAGDYGGCPVDCLAMGRELFVRWWPEEEGGAPGQERPADVWRGYRLEALAASYFVGNLIAHLSRAHVSNNAPVWFPLPHPGKEQFATNEIVPGENAPREVRQ